MRSTLSSFFFFSDPATTEIYTLSLHDALPISPFLLNGSISLATLSKVWSRSVMASPYGGLSRSEEHTSELQSRPHLVCRLLLEKKNRRNIAYIRCRPLWTMCSNSARTFIVSAP